MSLEAALAAWGMEGASVRLVAERENRVFRVERGRAYALRLRRPGYRTDAEIASELAWMAAAADGGLRVPRPVPSRSGALSETAGGVRADMLAWLPGAPIGRLEGLGAPERAARMRALGTQMARLHAVSDAWAPPPGFSRPDWGRAGLVGAAPLWGRFWEAPVLGPADRRLMGALRETGGAHLARIEDGLDRGLIHADLVGENVLWDGAPGGDGACALIDFDDGGWGFRLFDVATSLGKLEDDGALRAALLSGYRAVRPLDDGPLDLFLALRAASYVGWVSERMDEPGAEARAARLVRTARLAARRYLGAS